MWTRFVGPTAHAGRWPLTAAVESLRRKRGGSLNSSPSRAQVVVRTIINAVGGEPLTSPQARRPQQAASPAPAPGPAAAAGGGGGGGRYEDDIEEDIPEDY